ncbi:MAG: glycoside hydrolase family 13 [Gemmatimonadetes bacterium]|nr:MAG: glycoside hydrolase family 13 [Gemmatimonadota bacterium]
MSGHEFHPLVKQLLDGDITLADLPAELRAEGEEALRLLARVARTDVTMPAVTWRVMAALERRRRRFLPWLLAPALAAAAVLVLWLRPGSPPPSAPVVTVRFVLVAPEARQVSLAGTFNQWDSHATPLVRTGPTGVWTATLTLPAGQHQYAFVVDGVRWVPDPGAPAVDDGFGRRNSVLTL